MLRKKSATVQEKASAEGDAMAKAFKLATARAKREAFQVRKTIMVERDGWLVMINKAGKIVKRVKRLTVQQGQA